MKVIVVVTALLTAAPGPRPAAADDAETARTRAGREVTEINTAVPVGWAVLRATMPKALDSHRRTMTKRPEHRGSR